MSALAEADVTRLIKLCGLLGSAAVGERAAAALKVSEFLSAKGVGWDELLAPEETLPAVSVSVGSAPAESTLEAYSRGYTDGQRQAQMQAAAQAPISNYANYAAQQAQAAMNQAAGPYQPYGGFAGGLGQATVTPRTWRDAVQDIRLRGTLAKPGEQQFVQDLATRRWPSLTPKQEQWLLDICNRLGVQTW